MRYTNVKTFHKDFFKEVRDLPVTVTKYGVPVATVTRYGKTPEKNSIKISKKVEKLKVATGNLTQCKWTKVIGGNKFTCSNLCKGDYCEEHNL